MKRICTVLGISRATAYRQTKPRPRFYTRAEDGRVLEEIRTITRRKDSYGYRRVTAR
ncbi:MAG: IS3 family transposase, partial [Gemmatimonadetes bacterium]|nr:IS3 family transposase [Gemmatimonadota bacterium]